MAKGYPIAVSIDDAITLDVVLTEVIHSNVEACEAASTIELKDFWQGRIDRFAATKQRIMAALDAANLVEVS